MAKKIKNNRTVAVVDIGSNSVAMIIYSCAGNKYSVICKNKVACGLARNLSCKHPQLNGKGKLLALKTLRSFAGVLETRQPDEVIAVGTAAMRNVAHTKNGQAFHRQAERALRHKIKVISGKREASLTAHGVMSGLPKADGVCGDLGGGSIEFASIHHGGVGHTSTLDMGVLTLESNTRDLHEAEMIIKDRLKRVSLLKKHKNTTFYPVGGSFRAVARVMMKMMKIPSRTMQGFTVNADKARALAVMISRKNPAVFRKMNNKISKRADFIAIASIILVEIIDHLQPRNITFSAHGIREGLLGEAMEN